VDTQGIQIVEKLQKMHLFRNVRIDDLERLVTSCEIIRYSIAQSICNQGDQATNALILIDGKLEVSIRTENTVRHVGEIFPGEIFGEQGLFHSKGVRSATVMANKPSTCLILTPDFMRKVADNTAMVALERHLIATMARRIRATNLAIQKAWKESEKEAEKAVSRDEQNTKNKKDTTVEQNQPSGLLGKLRSLFGG
jgi:CRP-like cAMP-binding protein